jgi:glutaredoxin
VKESALVDRGIELVLSLEALTAELKAIEEKLHELALAGEQVPLEDKSREGRQYLARGTSQTVPVVLTSDILVATCQDASSVQERIKAAAGDHFTTFFKRVVTWKRMFDDGQVFRRKADEILGAAAPAFIVACRQVDRNGIPKSAIKVDWERAK